MEGKKRPALAMENSEEANKRQKIVNKEQEEPSLTDLPDDLLLHLLNFVGGQSLITLATTSSRMTSIVDAHVQQFIKRIFLTGYNHLLDPANRSKAVEALEHTTKISTEFGYKMKIMSLLPADIFLPKNQVALRAPFQLLKWDEHKLAHISRDYRRCTIICTRTGRLMCTINFDADLIDFASSSHRQIAFVTRVTGQREKVLVYSFDEQYGSDLVSSFEQSYSSLRNIAWTASNDLVFMRMRSFELCTVTGQILRKKQFGSYSRATMSVSIDGTFIICGYNEGFCEFTAHPQVEFNFIQINLADGAEQFLFQISYAGDLVHLQFVENNPDLVKWNFMDVEGGSTAMCNLKTKQQWYWRTSIRDISRTGTKIVKQIEDQPAQYCIMNAQTNEKCGMLKAQDNLDTTTVPVEYFYWTYPITNDEIGPTEKLINMNGSHINVYDPNTGEHMAQVKYFGGVDVYLQLVAVSRDNRTLVFADPFMNYKLGNAVVWHFY